MENEGTCTFGVTATHFEPGFVLLPTEKASSFITPVTLPNAPSVSVGVITPLAVAVPAHSHASVAVPEPDTPSVFFLNGNTSVVFVIIMSFTAAEAVVNVWDVPSSYTTT